MSADPYLARWNARFAAREYIFGTEPNAFLLSQRARLRPGWKALVPADGEGRNGVWLARQGLDVTTVDFSPVAIAKAQRLAARFGVSLHTIEADLNQWDWPEGVYDVLVAVFIQIFPPSRRDVAFTRMKRALRPGGLLLVQGYRPEQVGYATGGPPRTENMYTEEMLRASFGDFSIVSLRAHDVAIHEGHGHDGRSAVIDLVATRPL